MHKSLPAAVLLLVAVGCHDHDDHEHGDDECGLEANCSDTLTYSAGMEIDSEGGNITVRLVAVEPSPPDVMGTWTIEIVDSAGAVIPTATVTWSTRGPSTVATTGWSKATAWT